MKTYFIFFLILISINSYSQQRWIANFPQNLTGGGNGFAICNDHDGNVIVGGSELTGNGGYGALIKYDILGNLLWIDSINTDAVNKVICIGNDIYATGVSHATTTQPRMFVAKWDSAGNKVWMWEDTLTGINNSSSGYCIIENGEGNIFALGEPGTQTTYLSNILAVGLTPGGNEIWKQSYTGINYNYSTSTGQQQLVADSAGDLYIGGSEEINFNPPEFNMILFKVDRTNGNMLWLHRYDSGPASNDLNEFLGVLNGNTIIQYGSASSSVPYNFSVLFHYDTSGNVVDSIIIYNDSPSHITMDSYGNLTTAYDSYVMGNYPIVLKKHSYAGILTDSIVFNSYTNNPYSLDLKIDSAGNNYLLFQEKVFCSGANFGIAKFDPSFNLMWFDTIDAGLSLEEYPNKIFVDQNQNVMATGFGNFICPSSDQTITTAYWSSGFFNSTQNIYKDVFQFSIHPNPSNGKFYYSLENFDNSTAELFIYDMPGKLMCHKKLLNGLGEIETNLNTGVYICKIVSKKQSITRRIVIEIGNAQH